MINELIYKLDKSNAEYDFEMDFAQVKSVNNGLVDCILMQRNFLYKDCILLGNYNPVEKDKGIIILVSKAKYPCFIPFFFLNNSFTSDGQLNNQQNPNDTEYSSKGDFIADTNKLDAGFLNGVQSLCNRLGINSNDLLMVMQFESLFNAQAKNPRSNATGLIQFLPSTARSLGTTVEELYRMNRIQQLFWVEKYLQPYNNKLKNLADVCMSIFFPTYIGKSLNTEFPDNVKRANPGITTIQDYVNLVLSRAKRQSAQIKLKSNGSASIEN